ncbi:MAG: aminotransferase class I/II-fold pyridoxal phosphate-dependent enzyme [Planctomycetota bacterium]
MREHTLPVHAGAHANPSHALAVPIYQTSTFRFDSAAHGAELAQQTAPTQLYTRWGNPTTHALECAIAELEGAEAALAFASGMGAGSAAVLAAVQSGDHVVAANCLYSGMTDLFENVLARFGVHTTFVDPTDLTALEAAVRAETKLIYVETPANPTLQITDLAAVAELGRNRRILTMADNTWASPWNTRPIALGIDAVVHSATKYLAGHSDVVAGAVAGSRAFVDRVWTMLKVFGACISPHDAFLVHRGIKTLGVRVERHNASAMALARALAADPRVERVYYPGLEDHPGHAVAAEQMRGFGGMLSFELAGGIDAGKRAVERLRLVTHAVSLGGTESLAVHAASTTHGTLSEAARRRAGVSPGLIRVSVGLEDENDLIADFRQALS